MGQVQPSAPDRYNITFELYNVLTRQRLLGYQMTANKPGLRLASHQVADMVFEKILGIRGAFATRIAYISVLGTLPHKNYRLIVADADGENPHVVMQSNEPLDVAVVVAGRPEPGLCLLRGPAAVRVRAGLEDRRAAAGVGSSGREPGAGVVAGRQETGAHPVDAGRQFGYLRQGLDHPRR